jgi:hypothetical protein
LSDNRASSTATYKIAFDIVTADIVGSIRVQFCSNSALIDQPCTAPSGFDLSGATLSDQTGETGFSISPFSTANVLILTRSATGATPGSVSYTLDGVINPDSLGSDFGRIETYTSEDATGTHVDYGGFSTAVASPVDISTTVPPYLLFCSGLTITGFDCATAVDDYVNFGELSSVTPRTGFTQMVVATNAFGGYNVTVNGNTMTAGSEVIPALNPSDVSRPGVSQFGINLVANTDPPVGQDPTGPGSGQVRPDYAISNRYRFVSGDELVAALTSDDYRKYTVSYIVNVARDQAAGIYVSTLEYVCLANF